jgi:DNA-binding winged helix-turn-helix (wHTH) protein
MNSGLFRIDMERYLLLRDGEPIPLSPKVFETLLFLVENRGRVGKKDEIINSVWPDTFVEEAISLKTYSCYAKRSVKRRMNIDISSRFLESVIDS